MRILMIGKYPPIEGGVSAHTYWLARGLGEVGHTVSVVTNAGLVEEQYRIAPGVNLREDHEFAPKNVRVFSLEKEAPKHIPYSQGFVTRLVNASLRAIEEEGADVIYAHYLEPYGVAGLLLKQLTGLPLVVRHAGSDIYRLLKHPSYSLMLSRVIKAADAALIAESIRESVALFKKHSRPPFTRAKPLVFSPQGDKTDRFLDWNLSDTPLLTYLGKASEYKCLLQLLTAVKNTKDVRLLLVTNGPLLPVLRDRIAEDTDLQNRVRISSFIPPWKVPPLLRASTALVQLEHDFPIPIHGPGQPHEGIACGVPLLISLEMYKKISRMYPEKGEFTVVENPTNVDALANSIQEILDSRVEKKRQAAVAHERYLALNDWDAYIDAHTKLFEDVGRRTFSELFRF